MSFSNYWELEVLDATMGVDTLPTPTLYCALCTDDPTDAGTGASMNEVADSGSYARVDVSGDFGTAASSGSISNDAEIAFAEATGSWGTVSHFALVDSGTHGAGNMIASGALTASKTISSGDTASFAIGSLEITLD